MCPRAVTAQLLKFPELSSAYLALHWVLLSGVKCFLIWWCPLFEQDASAVVFLHWLLYSNRHRSGCDCRSCINFEILHFREEWLVIIILVRHWKLFGLHDGTLLRKKSLNHRLGLLVFNKQLLIIETNVYIINFMLSFSFAEETWLCSGRTAFIRWVFCRVNTVDFNFSWKLGPYSLGRLVFYLLFLWHIYLISNITDVKFDQIGIQNIDLLLFIPFLLIFCPFLFRVESIPRCSIENSSKIFFTTLEGVIGKYVARQIKVDVWLSKCFKYLTVFLGSNLRNFFLFLGQVFVLLERYWLMNDMSDIGLIELFLIFIGRRINYLIDWSRALVAPDVFSTNLRLWLAQIIWVRLFSLLKAKDSGFKWVFQVTAILKEFRRFCINVTRWILGVYLSVSCTLVVWDQIFVRPEMIFFE